MLFLSFMWFLSCWGKAMAHSEQEGGDSIASQIFFFPNNSCVDFPGDECSGGGFTRSGGFTTRNTGWQGGKRISNRLCSRSGNS